MHAHRHGVTSQKTCIWSNTVSSRGTVDNFRNLTDLNPLNAELNPIRHLLALVGDRHIVHVSRIRVNNRYDLRQKSLRILAYSDDSEAL